MSTQLKKILFAMPRYALASELEGGFIFEPVGHAPRLEQLGNLMLTTKPDILIITDVLRSETGLDLESAIIGARNVSPDTFVVLLLPSGSAAVRYTFEDKVDAIIDGDVDVTALGELCGLPPAGAAKAYTTMCWNPKGGVGKTSVTSTLAQAIPFVRPGTRVCLMDLDVYDADAADGMGIPFDQNHLARLIAANDYSPQNVANAIFHHRSGVDVLPAPFSPVDAFKFPLTPVNFGKIVEALRQLRYEVILFDPPVNPFIFKPALDALHLVDRIFIVITPDRFPIRAVRRVGPLLDELGWREKSRVIINKDRPHRELGSLSDEEVRRDLNLEVIARIRPDPAIGDGQEVGKTVWEMSSSASRLQFEALARIVLADAGLNDERMQQPAVVKSGGLSLFGKKDASAAPKKKS